MWGCADSGGVFLDPDPSSKIKLCPDPGQYPIDEKGPDPVSTLEKNLESGYFFSLDIKASIVEIIEIDQDMAVDPGGVDNLSLVRIQPARKTTGSDLQKNDSGSDPPKTPPISVSAYSSFMKCIHKVESQRQL